MAGRNAILVAGNPLKLAVFCANCSSGKSYVTAPERWGASWEDNVQLARLADEAGIEAMIPVARWKGYGGETNPNGTSWESITWACGLLAATRSINVFATVHVPLNHPVVAAKQMVTADHIGQGRFGINVVCGWNDDEFQMFGVTKKEHEDRYSQGAEWWTLVTRIWAGGPPFDFEGKHYQLRGVEGSPLPYGGQAPIMMNAGSSPSGRAFAIRYSDMHFDNVTVPEEASPRIVETRQLAREGGRTVQVWTPTAILCRPTQREADEYTRYLMDHADVGAFSHRAQLNRREGKGQADVEELVAPTREDSAIRRVVARGSYYAIGDPDHVASELARLRAAGFDGLAISFVNYLDEFPYFAQEVLPRLERLGIRATALSAAGA